ncbi:hypothetical protein M409DRAFT_51313 [Zasmidium cellare ATCC 36951]|uniref:YWTD domain-containing protein n=1 Tax=Zasmidium cellare ATCC 36951 TaxID=1080233 RepID=A0A6A6CYY1_ZASCE|nr:uncharacterized protein M409DRAFT_51313 [Zasmidium cellare ATCC 36951]KAF2171092.1 hypothetical protein M409DRAFT_51313 [Zasmidium cellare ATCC 36951]
MSPPTSTKLFFLSIYQATPEVPLDTQSLDDITHRGRLQVLDVNNAGQPKTLIDNAHMPDGIAIGKKNGRMYWTQMGTPGKNDGSVYSASLDGTNVRTVLGPGVANTPKQIVLDGESSKLYFCDREGLRVHRCNTDGSGHEVIIQTGDWQNEEHQKNQTRWCVGIAVSRRLGKIFWTQKGAPKSSQGRIFSANIEMPERSSPDSRPDIELVMEKLPEPIDLEVDEDTGTLYWTDRGEFPFGNTLNRKTIRGKTPEAERKQGRQILAEGFGEAIGLALDHVNQCVWVADLCGRIWCCDAQKPAAKHKLYESETSVLTGLAVLHD